MIMAVANGTALSARYPDGSWSLRQVRWRNGFGCVGDRPAISVPIRNLGSARVAVSEAVALVGRAFRDENRDGCPLTPWDCDRLRSCLSRVLRTADWALQCCFEHVDQTPLDLCAVLVGNRLWQTTAGEETVVLEVRCRSVASSL
jgi:hypothetical protein